ncbi:choline-sulfatase [gut metagenome]|uniref:Choline-sulfatase n=1 Tax=gut metagenome TaxID=749906 RepID=J9GSU6_9ZZZZ
MTSRNNFLKLLPIAAFSAPFQLSALPIDPPNIILIITDQHRADAVGCSGNDRVITPHIDSLAEDGYFFSSAYSATPSSTPARAGLLTGMSPWHHGMLGYGRVAEHYRYEMPQMLSDRGYLALGIGKMHWYPQHALHGFAATVLDESGRSESPYFMSDYRKWFQTVAPGKNPDETGIGWNDHGAAAYKLSEELHPTVWTGDVAVRTIEHYDGSKPLFLKVSFARPHSPYDPPQRLLDRYADIEMENPAKGEWSKEVGRNVTVPASHPSAAFGQFGDAYAKRSKKHYYASITFVDEQIGRIIQALKEKGMYDNTLICFTSDHGDMMGDHHHWRKTYAYEGSAAIPYIVKFPKEMPVVRPVGSVVDQPVELRDFLPTFLDLTGGDIPADMDGQSLVGLVQKPNPVWRRWIDLEHATCYSDHNYWCALTDGKIKYIWFLHTGEEQLFDLVNDPQETTDVSKDRKYQQLLTVLREAMVEHLSERGEEWVKNGQLVVRKSTLLYSPNYPQGRQK